MRYDYGYFEEDKLPHVTEVRLWRRIMIIMLPYWKETTGAILLSLLITAAGLALPAILRDAVDNFIVNQELETARRIAGLTRLAILFVGLIGVEFVAEFFQVVLLEWTGQRVMHTLRQDLFQHIQGLSLSFFNRNPVGKLVTRLTNDIQNMHEMFTSVIVTVFNDVIRLAGILVILFTMHWQLALIMCLLLPVILGNTIWFSRLARRVFRDIRSQLARLNSFLQESLSGISLLQLFGREKDNEKRFQALNETYLAKTMDQIKIFGVFMPLLEVLSMAATALIVWYGGSAIIKESMTLGDLVAFLAYMRLFFQPLRELSQKYSIVQSALASAERIFQLFDNREFLPLAAAPTPPETRTGTLSFRDVSFSYDPDRPVLHNVSFTVDAGETLAIVGATGSGKSSLINLLERLYDPDSGVITVGDKDIRDIPPRWLRHHIGLVMQDVFIVPDTMRANILLDKTTPEADLDSIIEQAQLASLIASLPEGAKTRLGEGGRELSSGQKQLLSFARVLARDPAILVLDEATSSVDTETEFLIDRAMETTLKNRTSIIIAHRLSTIRRADRIMVMENGRIAELGSHQVLMDAGGIYSQLQGMQSTE